MTLTAEYFDDYKNQIMDGVEDLIMSVNQPDKCPNYDFGMMELSLCMKKMTISNLVFDKARTDVTITANNFVGIKVYGKAATFMTDFNIYSTPEWIRDQGSGSITIKDFMVHVNVMPSSKDGRLQFNFIDSFMEADNIDGNFKGQTEIIESVQLIMNHFKTFFKEELTNIISHQLVKSI